MYTGIEQDLDYINSQIIAKQKNGKFAKWSAIGNTITRENFTEDDYWAFWKSYFCKSMVHGSTKYLTDEEAEEIKPMVMKVLERPVPRETIINLINESKMSEDEKERLLKLF